MVIVVYAKCDRNQRLDIQEDVVTIANGNSDPQIIGSDFNIVLNSAEKIGESPVTYSDVKDFHHCIESCDVIQVSYKGVPFTWWNVRGVEGCLFERLDRVLINSELQNVFSHTKIDYLPSQTMPSTP